jgi:hypothetical protein
MGFSRVFVILVTLAQRGDDTLLDFTAFTIPRLLAGEQRLQHICDNRGDE